MVSSLPGAESVISAEVDWTIPQNCHVVASWRRVVSEELMAKKPSEPTPFSKPEVTPTQAISLLQRQIEAGAKLLKERPLSADAFDTWELVTKNFLERAFGQGSPNIGAIMDVGKYGSFPMEADEAYWEERRAESLQTKLAKLQGLIELLQTELKLTETATVALPKPTGHRIFLVHGHDEQVLHQVARFLEQLEQEVIVLREQPNNGRTIIEKFEDFANVGFAVVLLTPDDRGGDADPKWEQQRPRARQNVIFELGYFIGLLGRNRVCALYRAGVEIPSDYSGVLFQPLDDGGGWRLNLAKELKAAGFLIDMNKAV